MFTGLGRLLRIRRAHVQFVRHANKNNAETAHVSILLRAPVETAPLSHCTLYLFILTLALPTLFYLYAQI